jgi:hypothetical protein
MKLITYLHLMARLGMIVAIHVILLPHTPSCVVYAQLYFNKWDVLEQGNNLHKSVCFVLGFLVTC